MVDAQLTEAFCNRVTDTGMTHEAIAKSLGVTKQFFSAVWNGKENPSVRFMTGAVLAGLGNSFADIAEPRRDNREKAA